MSAPGSASFTVVYDACVLYPAALRDLLMRLAVARLCRARWTVDILDEAFENLQAARPDLDPERLAVTRRRHLLLRGAMDTEERGAARQSPDRKPAQIRRW